MITPKGTGEKTPLELTAKAILQYQMSIFPKTAGR